MRFTDRETIRACILGLAVADAIGVPVEFCSREELDADPVTGVRGFGSHFVPAGTWSDDTSMTLCALDALAQETFSWESVMDNFVKWERDAAFTATDELFDIGLSCQRAIDNYARLHMAATDCGPTGARDNGNGSLMRILPFALYAPEDPALIETASDLTHGHRRAEMACGIYALLLRGILTGGKDGIPAALDAAEARYGGETEWKHYAPLRTIETRSRESIRSSGYVVDTLEAALWCLLTTDNYRDCILKAVNLGEDTDTVAAVAGGLAGGLYGLAGIPQEWLAALLRRELIEELCDRAAQRWAESEPAGSAPVRSGM